MVGRSMYDLFNMGICICVKDISTWGIKQVQLYRIKFFILFTDMEGESNVPFGDMAYNLDVTIK